MDIKFFIATFLIIVMFMIIIPLIAASFLYRKYGNTLPGKVAFVFVIGIFSYYGLFFTYGKYLIPEGWKPKTEQVYQCEWKTVYVEK